MPHKFTNTVSRQCCHSVFQRESLILFFTVIACDPDQSDAKMKLAEVYETMNEPKKALSLVYEGKCYIGFSIKFKVRSTYSFSY